MPLPTTLKLFIDAKAGLAYPTYSSTSPISNPSFYLGDLAKLRIYFIEQTGVGTYPRQEVDGLGSPGIRVAVGEIDATPTSGHFHLIFGGVTSFAFDYNVTASFMETKLNQMASITAAGGVTVSKVGDNYSIKFVNNGSRGDFTGNGLDLVPLSTVGISVLQEGDSTHPEIVLVHLQQNVAALATSFSAISASTISTSVLSAWDGARATYRASISPDPKGGTFTLAFDANTGTDVSTSAIAVGSTALEVQNALSKDALLDKVTVQQVGAYAYDITVTAQPGSGGLTGGSAGLLSFAGFEGDLDINTANAISYLDGAESLQTTFEVEISDGTSTQTVLQIPCTLRSSVVDETTVNAVTLDPVLTQATGDGRYLRQANDLSDLVDAGAARTNLDVYSKGETDAAIAAGGGGGGSGLPTSGGAMDANAVITFSNATNDSEIGGWGFGVENSSNTSENATVQYNEVRVSNSFGSTAIAAEHIVFQDSTTQSTAATTFNGGTVGSAISVTGSGGTVTLGDSVGLDLSGSTAGGAIKVGSSGITFSDSTVQSTAASPGLTMKQTIALALTAASGGGSFQWSSYFYMTGFAIPASGEIYNDWYSAGKFKMDINGNQYSFSYISNGSQYVSTTDDTSTYSVVGSGETLKLKFDGDLSPYPCLIT